MWELCNADLRRQIQATSIQQHCGSSWSRMWPKRQTTLQDVSPSLLAWSSRISYPFITYRPTYCLDITPQALIKLSVYPANSVCPSALHAKLTHSGSLLFLPTAVYSGFNSSTLLFFSRSKMMMELDVAAQSQYRFGEKTRAWISSPAVRE